MMYVPRPRAAVRRGCVLAQCAKSGTRRCSTAAQSSKADEEKGWPMKYKVAGGVILGTIVPWMGSYAVANDPATRGLVARLSPGLVQWLRKRKGGHFSDEDPKWLEYIACAREWARQPVTLDVRTPGGETRRLQELDPELPFTSIGAMAIGGSSSERGSLWLTDFDVMDDVGASSGGDHQEHTRDGGVSSTWETTAAGVDRSGSYGDFSPSSMAAVSAHRDVAACNIMSWWDIAALQEEHARAPPTAAASVSSKDAAGSARADQARAMEEHINRVIEALEQDKLSGARSVDDVEEQVRDLRKQQRDLRRKHRKKFLGLF